MPKKNYGLYNEKYKVFTKETSKNRFTIRNQKGKVLSKNLKL